MIQFFLAAADAVTTAASTVAETVAETAAATANITVDSWPVIKQIAWCFGKLMEGIFFVFSSVNIYSVTLCIVIFTIITKMLLLPMTIKQQKQSRITSYMQPELQELQKKYQGRRDQASMQKMQIEQQQIYDKYGSSMSAGCLPSLIQLPIIFALYPVIYKFTTYVPAANLIENGGKLTSEQFTNLFNLFGINLQEAPGFKLSWALLIPVLAGATSFLSSKLSMVQNKKNTKKGENPLGGSMNIMMYTMPLISVFFCIQFPAFIGVYWIVQAVVMCVQQLIINNKLSKMPIEDIIKENIERTNKKRAKKGLPPLNDKANINTKNISDGTKSEADRAARDAQVKASTEYYQNRGSAPEGSLAAKANMVRDYNERHEKKKG